MKFHISTIHATMFDGINVKFTNFHHIQMSLNGNGKYESNGEIDFRDIDYIYMPGWADINYVNNIESEHVIGYDTAYFYKQAIPSHLPHNNLKEKTRRFQKILDDVAGLKTELYERSIRVTDNVNNLYEVERLLNEILQ